jgi:glycosyltransferase involved in cell wall biosynthesis
MAGWDIPKDVNKAIDDHLSGVLMVKVVHLIQRYPPAVGGSETWCREVSQYLSSVGDEVRVLTMDILAEEEYWRDPPLHQWTVRLGRLDWDDGVLVRRYRRSLPVHLLYHLFFKLVLDRALHIYFYGPHSVEMYGRLFAEAPTADVVHLHTIPYPHNFIGYVVARLYRRRVVITPHFHPDHPHYERWSNYWLLKRCDAVIAVSDYERDYLIKRGVAPRKIVVTGNGVHIEDYHPKDLAQFKAELFQRHGLSEATKVILFIGRKLEYKGIVTLVDAFTRLSGERDAVLFLVGPTSSWFEEFYGKCSGKDRERIIDLGTVSEQAKVNLLHLADVLVLPSRFEAFGIVFLEAWACGTPVIGAASGAIPGVIGDGGMTFAYGDVEDLAEKLRNTLNDKQRSRDMALRGQQRLHERFTWEKIGSATRKTYLPAGSGGLRILICSSFFPPHYLGGAELIAYQQAKVLKKMGHEVQVFAGRLGANLLRSHRVKIGKGEFHKTWVNRSAQDISGASWDFHNPDVAWEFSKVLDDFSPDLVHFHNLVGLSLLMIEECHRRGIPMVMTLHDYWGICFKNTLLKNDGSLCKQGGLACLGCREMLAGNFPLPSPVRNAHVLLYLRKVNRFIAPSYYLAQQYAANGIPAEKISVIKNGIDLERFTAVQHRKDVLILGFIGHLGRHKGLDVLLRALALIDRKKVRLLVVGTGDEAGHLKALCRDLGIKKCVTFHGHIDHACIPSIYQKIDVLIVPSVWPENSPVTITEAMASGIPVIASDIGGVGELVEDAVTGFLVPLDDSPALAERIQRFLAHPELKEAMGAKALERIQRYRLWNQVDQIVGVYREVIAPQATQSPPAFDVLLYDSAEPWNLATRELFYQLAEVEEKLQKRLLICRADLADDELLRSAKLLLLSSPGPESFARALQALQRQIPILVPEEADELRELCLTSDAGLFYGNSDELRQSLLLLLSNEPLRQGLGRRGRKFLADLVTPGVSEQVP